MTFKEVASADVEQPIEELPHKELAAVEPTLMEAASAAMERHLAGGASATTLCGVDRSTVSTVHPSKARKTDCEACRLKLRDLSRKKEIATGDPMNERPIVKGDKVAMDDDSAWLVEDARDGGLDLSCLVGSMAHAKGRRTTVSRGAVLRLLSDAAFSELVGREKALKPLKEKPLKAMDLVGGVKASRAGVVPTKEQIAEVKRLRMAGLSYRDIDTAMLWPPSGGNRCFKICKK